MLGLRAPAPAAALPARGCGAGPRPGACAAPQLAPRRAPARCLSRGRPAAAAAGATGGVPGAPGNSGAPGHAGHELRAVATGAADAPAAAPPATAVAPPPGVQMSEVLRTIRLLERRETELRDEMRDLLSLMAASAQALAGGANPGVSPQLAREMQRLERAYTGGGSANAQPADEDAAISATVVDSTECTVQHPGALCCTRTTIALDETAKHAVLTLRTTVKQNGDALANARMAMSEYVALGAQALCIAANELSCERTASASELPSSATQTHAQLVAILAHGRIVHAEPNNDSNGNHPSYRVELEHEGRRARAIFKPRVPGDGDGWHRATMEWVSYELNLMLGMDYVPPVAYRRGGIDCNYEHYEEGAFILWVDNATELREAEQAEWGVPAAALLSDTRILDVLLANSDRHHGHFLLGNHWLPPHGRMPVLIDHAAAFRKEAFVTLDHENAFRTGPVRCVSSRTYLRLRFLDARAIAARFAGTLSTSEMRALLTRRNGVLERLDALVEAQGYERTVIEL